MVLRHFQIKLHANYSINLQYKKLFSGTNTIIFYTNSNCVICRKLKTVKWIVVCAFYSCK